MVNYLSNVCDMAMRFRDFLAREISEKIPVDVRLPQGYHVIGHVILLRVDQSAAAYEMDIAEATLKYEKKGKTVLVWRGPTEGQQRTPNYEFIAGNPTTETLHIEAGVRYFVDPMKLTFSGGNRAERIGLPRVVDANETVVDMFAGVGQFAVPIAKRAGARVIAIEINPVAFKYLLRNIDINHVKDKVQPINSDCRQVALNGVADRVIMGFLHQTNEYLSFAIGFLKENGGIIHLHQGWPKTRNLDELFESIRKTVHAYHYTCEYNVRQIKSYAPGVYHIAVEIEVKT